MLNQTVLQRLPQAPEAQGEYAVLARLDGASALSFLTMPLEWRWERTSTYAPSAAAGAVIPYQQFGGVGGWVLNLSLSLGTRNENKSLTSYLDAIASFQMPSVNQFAPPVLALRWGLRSFSPCVMSKMNKRERGWFSNGDLAEAIVQFTLVEVSSSQIVS